MDESFDKLIDDLLLISNIFRNIHAHQQWETVLQLVLLMVQEPSTLDKVRIDNNTLYFHTVQSSSASDGNA